MFTFSRHLTYQLLLSSLFLLLFFTACKKEYPAYPYNTITSFTIKDNNGIILSAVIDSNTIIVYWPPLQMVPDSVTPVISISDRAVVEPASGIKVPFRQGLTYTVKAQDGTVQTFLLKPAISQPPVMVSGITLIGGPGNYLQTDLTYRMDGQYFIADPLQTAVYFVARKGGGQTKATLQPPLSTSALRFAINIPDTGIYDVKLMTGLQTLIAGTEIITLPAPELTFPQGAIVQRGGTLTINGKYLGAISSIVTYDDDFNGPYPLVIVSQTSASITVQIPIDLTPGEYIDFSVERGGNGTYYDFYVDPGNGVTVQ